MDKQLRQHAPNPPWTNPSYPQAGNYNPLPCWNGNAQPFLYLIWSGSLCMLVNSLEWSTMTNYGFNAQPELYYSCPGPLTAQVSCNVPFQDGVCQLGSADAVAKWAQVCSVLACAFFSCWSQSIPCSIGLFTQQSGCS